MTNSVLPLLLPAVVLMHLIVLHDSANSGNPLGVSGNYDRLPLATPLSLAYFLIMRKKKNKDKKDLVY